MLAATMWACSAHEKPSRVETTLANVAKDVVIPIEARGLANPLHNGQQTQIQGRRIYLESCAICHGPEGRGQTTLGQDMYPPAMDLTSPHVQHWDDSDLFWIIQNGVPMTGMPSWKNSISADETWKLVIFIHDLPQLDAAASETATEKRPAAETEFQLIAYGRTLYRQEGCFTCHRLDGEGGEVGPDLSVEGTRDRSAAWLIGHFKNPGAYTPGSIMPSFKNLTDEQLRALTTFLLNQTNRKNPK